MISRHIARHASALGRFLVASACLVGAAAAAAACDSPDADAVAGTTADTLGQEKDEAAAPPAQPATTAQSSEAPSTKPPVPTKPPVVAPPDDATYLDFVGAWKAIIPGNIATTLVFTDLPEGAGHQFFGHPENPTAKTRPHGTYVLSKGKLVLDSSGLGLDGSYDYSFASVNQLKLQIGTEAQTFERVASYCDAPADCGGQGIIHPACVGAFACEKNACLWVCETTVDPPSGPKCGPNTVCGAGEVCCNESCGICTKPGQGCTKQLCLPEEPVKCGDATCEDGEVCCNESCGICTKPGDACTQQLCPATK